MRQLYFTTQESGFQPGKRRFFSVQAPVPATVFASEKGACAAHTIRCSILTQLAVDRVNLLLDVLQLLVQRFHLFGKRRLIR